MHYNSRKLEVSSRRTFSYLATDYLPLTTDYLRVTIGHLLPRLTTDHLRLTVHSREQEENVKTDVFSSFNELLAKVQSKPMAT